ncbi:MAG: tryptophan-rich sensory protein [Peptococcaceae bacterium]|nr:tryptophan-rich sensory protein [Peptococcaceae bacterium]
MRIRKWKPYAVFIVLTEAVGALSGFLTRDGTKTYEAFAAKPALTPPGAVFPVVWSVLYALMGIGAARIWRSPASAMRKQSIILFAAQLAVNFVWSLLFFNAKVYGFAFIWLALLWILIVLMIRAFYQVDKTAAYLQIPYLLWVTFAGYLNFMVWQLN